MRILDGANHGRGYAAALGRWFRACNKCRATPNKFHDWELRQTHVARLDHGGATIDQSPH